MTEFMTPGGRQRSRWYGRLEDGYIGWTSVYLYEVRRKNLMCCEHRSCEEPSDGGKERKTRAGREKAQYS